MSEQPKVPKFRVSAAFVSPAALCLIAGTIWFFTLDRTSEDDVEATVQKEFPHVVRTSHEVDDRMREFFRRVNNNDPREEERMRNLLNKGKGSNYSAKRHHATAKDIEEFGFVPESSSPGITSAGSGKATTAVETKPRSSASKPARGKTGAQAPETGSGMDERKPGRKWWFW